MILEQLGFIGLGAMGSRMAANLQARRHAAEFPLHFRTRREARASNAYLISSANS